MITANAPVAPVSPSSAGSGQEPARAASIGGQSSAVQQDSVVRAAALQRVPGLDLAAQAEALRKRRRSYRDPFQVEGIHQYEDVQDWEHGYPDVRGRFLDLLE